MAGPDGVCLAPRRHELESEIYPTKRILHPGLHNRFSLYIFLHDCFRVVRGVQCRVQFPAELFIDDGALSQPVRLLLQFNFL